MDIGDDPTLPGEYCLAVSNANYWSLDGEGEEYGPASTPPWCWWVVDSGGGGGGGGGGPVPTVGGITFTTPPAVGVGNDLLTITGSRFGVSGFVVACPADGSGNPCVGTTPDTWNTTNVQVWLDLSTLVAGVTYCVEVQAAQFTGAAPVGGPCGGSFYVAAGGTVTISINNTADTSDDVTVLSPAQTIPATVTLNGASGTVQLSVSPAGRASIDQTTLNLTSGVPATVTITPLKVSQAPNDVQIVATFNGVPVGQGKLTIVGITIPPITNADTPAGMPNRIPPTAKTPIQITVAPDLTGSGQSITLAKIGNSGANGDFTIDGSASEAISKTTTVNLSGTTQTAQTGGSGGGNAGNLALVAQVRGQAAVQSSGFSVAAIPMNFTDVLLRLYNNSNNGGNGLCGMQVQDGWASDSGTVADLDQVMISEKVQVQGTATGILQFQQNPSTSGYQSATDSPPPPDTHAVACNLIPLPMPGGSLLTEAQVSVFEDFRTGAVNVPMANSGFLITFAIAPDGSGVNHLTVIKTGAAETVSGSTSNAGTTTPPGGIQTTQP